MKATLARVRTPFRFALAVSMGFVVGNFGIALAATTFSTTGITTDAFTVGSTSTLQVNTSGNLTKVNNVSYNWPSSQGASTQVLTNDGAGNLTWAAASGGGGGWTDDGTTVRLTTTTDTVGIGTTTPTGGARLDVRASTVGTGAMIASFGGLTVPRIQLFDEGGGLGPKIRFDAGNFAQIEGTSSILLMPAYNIGIKTTAPIETLDINGNIRVGQGPTTSTTLTSGMTATDTTANVVSTVGYPETGTLLIGNEAMTYSGKNGTAFVGLTRGRLGTTAAIQPTSSTVDHYILTAIANTTTPRMVLTGSGGLGIGDASPASLLTVGSGDLFQVNSSGDIVKIENVTYNWPSSQGGASTVLTNNGSGVLSWAAASAAPAGSSGQIQFNSSGSFGANARLHWNSTDNNLIISSAGTVTTTLPWEAHKPKLTVMAGSGSTLFPSMAVESFSTNTGVRNDYWPLIMVGRSNNATEGTMTYPVNNQTLGSVEFAGAIETTQRFHATASITAATTENWNNAENGTYLSFWTTNTDTNGLTERGRFEEGGSFRVVNLASCAGIQTNGSGTMSCSSDGRLKDVRGEFTPGLDAVLALDPKSYSWKEGTNLYDGGIVYHGFIAQDVQEALPEAVNVGKDGQLQLGTLPLVAATVNAIQELKVENDMLKAELCARDATYSWCK